jgi:hypothetical protein
MVEDEILSYHQNLSLISSPQKKCAEDFPHNHSY